MAKRDIVVVGGSAGSAEPLKALISALPRDFPASLFITTHIPSTHETYLPHLLNGPGRLPVVRAVDGQLIEPGHIYVAAPDRHLLLIGSTLRLGLGPRENMARPSIDPMFRSAALSFGPRVVGVILSGMLNDGASGLFAVKQAGGVAVVQHPLDARYDEMPRAALEVVHADYVARSAELAETLREVVVQHVGPEGAVPESLVLEVEVANGARLGSERLRSFAEPVPLTCPDCDGVLSEVKDTLPLRYRCQIGHAYTAEDLAARHEKVDAAIRVAMRVMEERVELVGRMARDARASGRGAVAELYERRAREYARYAATLREAALLSRLSARAEAEPQV